VARVETIYIKRGQRVDLRLKSKLFTDAELQRVAMQQMESTQARILTNVTSGRDMTGRKLKSYSPGYKHAIEQGLVRSRSTGVPQVSTATNLTISGQLLRSLTVRPHPRFPGAILDFEGHHTDADKDMADLAKELEDRGFKRWFGFSKKLDGTLVMRAFARLVDKKLDNLVD